MIDVLDLDIDLIDIRDIAHSLSLQCRFNGHSSEFYSVAQHCVYVARMLPKKHKRAGLLHDGTETYLCDIPSPLKPHLLNYKALEHRAALAIEKKWFGGESVLEHPLVKEADTRMLATEFRDLRSHNSPVEHWTSLKGVKPYDNLVIKPWSAKKAEKKFLEKFYELTTE
jgi:5'-deoxynucleotidase YfbR-like HD superfamily hydrolase